MRPVVLRPEATEDLEQAQEWYESKLEGLGERFLDAVEVALRKIEDFPEAPSVIYRGVRFMALRKFPYGVFYQVLDDRVDVLAIVHGRRASRVWKERLE
jgi:plasmid stabilization system protein ParE